MSSPVPIKLEAITHEVAETGEVVVFDKTGSQLLVLNEVAAAVWLLLDGARSVAEIAALIIETLPADPAQVEADIVAFLKTLETHGLIELKP
jgi:hypothetical protein